MYLPRLQPRFIGIHKAQVRHISNIRTFIIIRCNKPLSIVNDHFELETYGDRRLLRMTIVK